MLNLWAQFRPTLCALSKPTRWHLSSPIRWAPYVCKVPADTVGTVPDKTVDTFPTNMLVQSPPTCDDCNPQRVRNCPELYYDNILTHLVVTLSDHPVGKFPVPHGGHSDLPHDVHIPRQPSGHIHRPNDGHSTTQTVLQRPQRKAGRNLRHRFCT